MRWAVFGTAAKGCRQRVSLFAAIFALGILALSFPSGALGWAPYDHLYAAHKAYEDVVDKGAVSINGHAYSVDPTVVTALKKWPEFFNGGVIGPDAFPDIAFGQSVVHPGPPGPISGIWLERVFQAAWDAQSDARYSPDEREQILAWSYGFLIHGAEDMWGHTFVNDFAGGVYPSYSKAAVDPSAAAIIIRHIVVESYVESATPGFAHHEDPQQVCAQPGNPPPATRCRHLNDGKLDWSDDTTPGIAINAPTQFIYNSMLGPNAFTGGGTDPPSKGIAVDFFEKTLRPALKAYVDANPNPPSLQDALDQYNKVKQIWQQLQPDCDPTLRTSSLTKCATDFAQLFEELAELGVKSWKALDDLLTTDSHVLFAAYAKAWIADIDRGLQHWPELSVAIARGVFDPQARRDVQNKFCAGIDEVDRNGKPNKTRAECENHIGIGKTIGEQISDFENRYLYSMLGLPDVYGQIEGALSKFTDFFRSSMANLGLPYYPFLAAAKSEIIDWGLGLLDKMISERFGIDVDLVATQDAFEDFVDHPGHWTCIGSANLRIPKLWAPGSQPLPGAGAITVGLFPAGAHAALDSAMGMTADHHELDTGFPPNVLPRGVTPPKSCGPLVDDQQKGRFDLTKFAAMSDTVQMAKLTLLGAAQLNKVVGDQLVADGIIMNDSAVQTYIDTRAGVSGTARGRFCTGLQATFGFCDYTLANTGGGHASLCDVSEGCRPAQTPTSTVCSLVAGCHQLTVTFDPTGGVTACGEAGCITAPPPSDVLLRPANIMIDENLSGFGTWDRRYNASKWFDSMDSDHAWRINGLPSFCDRGTAPCPASTPSGHAPLRRASDAPNGGSGYFPIWASCLMRPAFRSLFIDWENQSENFPLESGDALNGTFDDPSAYAVPASAITQTTIRGPTGESETVFTIDAKSALFASQQIGLEYRLYSAGSSPGPWVAAQSRVSFTLPVRATGRWIIEYHAQDPCHTFRFEPNDDQDKDSSVDELPPETVHSLAVDVGGDIQPAFDGTAPAAKIHAPCRPHHLSAGICHAYKTKGLAWRRLVGTAVDGAPSSGIASVQVNAVRKSKGTCRAFDGKRFSPLACNQAPAIWVDAVLSSTSKSKTTWRLALPGIKSGSYRFAARATDRSGNTQSVLIAGRNLIVVKLH